MNDRQPTFLELLEKLTADHPEWVQRESGQTLMTQTGLLQQLREAVFSGMENTGGGSSFGSKPPLDAAATDLLNLITQQATEALAAVSNLPTPYGHAEHYVKLWAGQTTPLTSVVVSTRVTDHGVSELEAHALNVTRVYDVERTVSSYALMESWVNAIESFFNPPRNAEIKAPCPACEVQSIYREVHGENIRTASFVFVRDRGTGDTLEARCLACGEAWGPDKFEWLAGAIGAKADTI